MFIKVDLFDEKREITIIWVKIEHFTIINTCSNQWKTGIIILKIHTPSVKHKPFYRYCKLSFSVVSLGET